MAANDIKTLRLLTDDRQALDRLYSGYPEMLRDMKDLLFEHFDNNAIKAEVRGLIYNWKQVAKRDLPHEFEKYI